MQSFKHPRKNSLNFYRFLTKIALTKLHTLLFNKHTICQFDAFSKDPHHINAHPFRTIADSSHCEFRINTPSFLLPRRKMLCWCCCFPRVPLAKLKIALYLHTTRGELLRHRSIQDRLYSLWMLYTLYIHLI